MAKMFYSMDEVQEKLHLSAEEIKKLIETDKLREFRDGAKVMFKIDEVDSFDLSGLSSTGSGEIGLLPEDSVGDIALPASDSADQISLDDTSEPANKDDTVITSHGVNVLDDSDELDLTDPMAQTQITPSFDDQVHLDSGSSGSGLLDLTREADDTSLGAELLEEIYPGADEGAIETQLPTELEVPSSVESVGTMDAQSPPIADFAPAVAVYDPSSGAFGVMMVVPFLVLTLLACVAASGIAGVRPVFLDGVANYVWYIIGAAGALAIIIALIGNFISGMAAAGHPKTAKEKKTRPKKTKKQKK